MPYVIAAGLRALEDMVDEDGFCYGDRLSVADI